MNISFLPSQLLCEHISKTFLLLQLLFWFPANAASLYPSVTGMHFPMSCQGEVFLGLYSFPDGKGDCIYFLDKI